MKLTQLQSGQSTDRMDEARLKLNFVKSILQSFINEAIEKEIFNFAQIVCGALRSAQSLLGDIDNVMRLADVVKLQSTQRAV
ncbi:MAG: hypothetical protein ACFHVJ_07785 [Aestuariibacter sp.]